MVVGLRFLVICFLVVVVAFNVVVESLGGLVVFLVVLLVVVVSGVVVGGTLGGSVGGNLTGGSFGGLGLRLGG